MVSWEGRRVLGAEEFSRDGLPKGAFVWEDANLNGLTKLTAAAMTEIRATVATFNITMQNGTRSYRRMVAWSQKQACVRKRKIFGTNVEKTQCAFTRITTTAGHHKRPSARKKRNLVCG